MKTSGPATISLVALFILSCGSQSRLSDGGDAGPPGDTLGDSACSQGPSDVLVSDGVSNFLDLNVVATGFVGHDGKTVRFLTRSTQTHETFGVARATIAGGAFMFHFPAGYQRFSYQEAFWFVDLTGDGLCDTGAGDHVGYSVTNGFNPVDNEPYDLHIDDNHVGVSALGFEVCSVMNACQ